MTNSTCLRYTSIPVDQAAISEQSLSPSSPPGADTVALCLRSYLHWYSVLRIYTPSQYREAYNDFMLDSIRTADTLAYGPVRWYNTSVVSGLQESITDAELVGSCSALHRIDRPRKWLLLSSTIDWERVWSTKRARSLLSLVHLSGRQRPMLVARRYRTDHSVC